MSKFVELGGAVAAIAGDVNEYIRSLNATMKEKFPEGFDTEEQVKAFRKEQLELTGIIAPLNRLGASISLVEEDEWDWMNAAFSKVYK